ncbi:retrovirus-related pol polyprotein from transposon TNT 1-94 [Tanacetum coccineum]
MVNTIMEVLHTLHMDLCGPIRVQCINGKKYILVIVDDYSRFTGVKFLRSKDETPEFVVKLNFSAERRCRTTEPHSCGSCSDYADLLQGSNVSLGRSYCYFLLLPKPIVDPNE